MNTDVLIVGGGLSGLALAPKLEKSGVNYLVVEANDRLGGRILTKSVKEVAFDYGPAWFWPGQPRMARAIDELGLATLVNIQMGRLNTKNLMEKFLPTADFRRCRAPIA